MNQADATKNRDSQALDKHSRATVVSQVSLESSSSAPVGVHVINLIDFYLGKAPDHRGRMLEDMLRWSDHKLEAGHDFIQALFPLAEPSESMPNTPVLDPATLTEFQKNPAIQKNLVRSLQMMLRFYGFQADPATRVVSPAPDFHVKAPHWLFLGDHNHYRITRILKCLSTCGLKDHATSFLNALLAIAEPGKVSEETVGYWKRAVPG